MYINNYLHHDRCDLPLKTTNTMGFNSDHHSFVVNFLLNENILLNESRAMISYDHNFDWSVANWEALFTFLQMREWSMIYSHSNTLRQKFDTVYSWLTNAITLYAPYFHRSNYTGRSPRITKDMARFKTLRNKHYRKWKKYEVADDYIAFQKYDKMFRDQLKISKKQFILNLLSVQIKFSGKLFLP